MVSSVLFFGIEGDLRETLFQLFLQILKKKTIVYVVTRHYTLPDMDFFAWKKRKAHNLLGFLSIFVVSLQLSVEATSSKS